MENNQKKILQIDSFHFTSFLARLFFSGPHCVLYITKISSNQNSKQPVVVPDRILPRLIILPFFSLLANRPGFPFLGNDFFAALGDLYSCHAVDNPSMESELKMLKQYGIIFFENNFFDILSVI